MSGRLEIFFEGSWGQVCASDFNGVDANVACRQLGFGAGTVFPADPARFRGGVPPVRPDRVVPEAVVTAVGCNGSESTLLDCPLEMQGADLFDDLTCLTATGIGLIIGCVLEPVQGTLPPSCECTAAQPD